MQNVEKTVIKAATVLTNAVNKMAKVESENQEFNDFIESCNDTLALMGHANRQLNLARRKFMKPDVDSNYGHLCAQSVPYTSLLFGDDVSKAAKDIEDTRKIGNRMSGLGLPRGRGYYRGGRGRGSRRGGRYRRGFIGGFRSMGNSGANYDAPKNFPRRFNFPQRLETIVEYNEANEVSKTDKFQAGRLKNFVVSWENLTSDRIILDIVEHCHIEFEDDIEIDYDNVSHQSIFNEKQCNIIDTEIEN